MPTAKTKPKPVEETPEPLNAVVVVKTTDDEGNIGTEVVMNGNVLPTEVQTLLELAVKGWRQRIGLVD